MSTGSDLARISQWIDESPANAARDPEARLWGRIAKISEENGEVVAALIGASGQNPRKGVTHSIEDVLSELLDVALTALAAVEHVVGNDGSSIELLEGHVAHIVKRAGLDD